MKIFWRRKFCFKTVDGMYKDQLDQRFPKYELRQLQQTHWGTVAPTGPETPGSARKMGVKPPNLIMAIS